MIGLKKTYKHGGDRMAQLKKLTDRTKDLEKKVSRIESEKLMKRHNQVSGASKGIQFETAAWTRKEGKRESGGLNRKGVASYRAANPGSKLKTAVTKDPKKLKKGGKAAKRRASFCRRMRGMKAKRTSAKTANDPNSRINKSLRAWNCESVEELVQLSEGTKNPYRNADGSLKAGYIVKTDCPSHYATTDGKCHSPRTVRGRLQLSENWPEREIAKLKIGTHGKGTILSPRKRGAVMEDPNASWPVPRKEFYDAGQIREARAYVRIGKLPKEKREAAYKSAVQRGTIRGRLA